MAIKLENMAITMIILSKPIFNSCFRMFLMDPETIEKALKEKFSEEELQEKVEKKIAAFHGLLTREVALKMIARESGLGKEEAVLYALKDVPPDGKRIQVVAAISRIGPVKTYPSGNRARILLLQDDTAKMPLTVWNEDVGPIAQLKSGDRVEVKEAYERQGGLRLSYRGTIQLLEVAPFLPLSGLSLKEDQLVAVRGVVSRVEGKRMYTRGGGQYALFSVYIRDDSKEMRGVFWEGIERAEKLQEGDEIILENARVKGGEIHIHATARMLVKKAKGIRGILQEIRCEGERATLRINDQEVTLARGQVLPLLGLEVSPDVALSTIVTLKKDALVNKPIAIDTARMK